MAEGLRADTANVRNALERLSMDLNVAILKLGSLVEEMIAGAVDALGRQDSDSARTVLSRERPLLSHARAVDALCLAALGGAPQEEGRTRLAVATMAIARDLGTLAGLAADIAGLVADATALPPSRFLPDLRRLEEIARRTLRDLLNGYARRSASLARSMAQDENEEDAICRFLERQVGCLMQEDPEQVPGAIPLLIASRSLRRMCLQARRSAESIVFLVEGASAAAS